MTFSRCLFWGLMSLMLVLPASAQSTAFTFQGSLNSSASPANGAHDFIFRLYDSSGTQVGGDLVRSDVAVTNGIFAVTLDFGNAPFATGAATSLEISVRPGTSKGEYTILDPRSSLLSAPYAVKSLESASAVNATNAVNAINATTATNATNADLLDGVDSSGFFKLGANEIVTGRPSFSGGISGSTAPFSVSSNTLVTNLNADLLDGLSSSSLVPITGGTMTGELTVSNTSSGTGNGIGLRGLGGSIGTYGYANGFSFSGNSIGVFAGAQGSAGTRYGLLADAVVFSGVQSAYGVYGVASGAATNYAGYFQGNTHVTGTLSKGAGAFKIDHPLDPENRFLQHSFVESPDMMNIYNGNVTTDESGNATVELPPWFDALNREFRYQLTVIGQFAQAIVSEEISSNKFSIRTDKPNVKVSWQVTGVRKDRFAEDNRIKVELEKSTVEKGKCLYAPLCSGRSLDPGEDARKDLESRRNAQKP